MSDETPPDLLEPDGTEEDPEDVLALLDRLEELVGVGRRMPFSTRVMVEEEEFLGLMDQIRAAVPREIRHAQRVVEERAEIGRASCREREERRVETGAGEEKN